MVEGDMGRRLIAVGGEHDGLAKHVYRVAAEYELPTVRCDDIYTAVADLAAERDHCALVVGPLRELAREGGHFFRVAARNRARCAVLLGPRGADGRDDVLMAVRAGAWVIDRVDELLGVVETWLARPVHSPAGPRLVSEEFRATEAELDALLGQEADG
jgi:hypothetical protein